MKSYILLFLLLSSLFCTQKQNPFDDRSALVSVVNPLSSGTPKSFGLDLKIDSRLNRGCETRIGNLMADVFADKGNSILGFYNGGAIREDFGLQSIYPNSIIPKGTIPNSDLLKKLFPLTGGNLVRINLNTYRLKQALEVSVGRLNARAERGTDDIDSDGPTHGNCWLNPNLSGAGRFLHVSSKMQIEVNPVATAVVIGGSGTTNTLVITSEGRRIIKIIIDGILLYNNSTGDITSGWSAGQSSCTIKGITYSNSAACNFYSATIPKFQFDGGDSNATLNPNMLEVNNDGSVVVSQTGIGANLDDGTILNDYLQKFTTGPVYPRISGRILMP